MDLNTRFLLFIIVFEIDLTALAVSARLRAFSARKTDVGCSLPLTFRLSESLPCLRS